MKKILYILLGLLVLASCGKFLDVKPVGKLIPTKVEEFERLLNNSDNYNWDYMDNNLGCALALLGDNFEYSVNVFDSELDVGNPNVDRLMAYKFNRPYTDPYLPDYYWDWGIYRASYNYNNIIEGVEGLDEKDEDYAAQVIAQALAGRALSYLNAAFIYGPSYKPNGANDGKAIPYRTSASVTADNPMISTTQEVFDRAEADLLAALENIPTIASGPTRHSKLSTKTALAYLYMLKGDFVKMLTYADNAWNDALAAKGSTDNMFYDYNLFEYVDNGIEPSPGADNETVWDLRYNNSPIGDFDKSYNKENILFRRAPTIDNRTYSSRELIDLFVDGDQRKRLFLLWRKGYANPFGGDDGIVKQYYKSQKMGNGTTTGFSYPELLLMRAEAYARNGQDANALADLNTVRSYRFDAATATLSGLSGDDLMKEILDERRRELPSPSYKRFIDIKRFAAYDVGKPWAKTTMVHELITYTAQVDGDGNPIPSTTAPSGTTFSGEVDSELFQWMISNTILEKNPDWGIPLFTGTYIPN